MNNYILDTGNLRLEFAPDNGALVSMVALQTGWHIERRPELGLSWRLLVPISGELRDNPVYGEKQKLSSVTQLDDGLRFVWEKIISERAGQLDVTVTVTVRNEGGQAVWHTDIDNRCPYQVECVYSPYLGDLTHPEGSGYFKVFHYKYAAAEEWNVWPVFDTHFGYYGTDYPTQFGQDSLSLATPATPFVLLHNECQGLYVGSKADEGEMVAWHLEHRPGWGFSIAHRVSEKDEIAGKTVHTLFAPVHMCYIMPGERRQLTPIAFQAYQGGWHQGADIYKTWRDAFKKLPVNPKWVDEPHAWLQLHINSPEDELRLRYTELPKVAAECARHGVKAIQLVGWNDGGQDQGNPSHNTDPRLGTFEELKQAIADCQAMGVRIILFAKFVWADRGTQWFRRELKNYAVKDPYGDYYMHPGYKYFTPAQLLDINTKRLIPMCFGSEKYMEICTAEFKKFIELNADGFLFDECMHHTPAWLCFDTTHGHRYGWPVYSRDREFIERLRRTPGMREDFMMAGEAIYDQEYDVYNLSYHRSEDRNFIPLSRYLRPRSPIMTAITGFEDRNMVNQCLMYRYIISYEPYNFKGWLHDYPVTLEYGKQMDALRIAYRKYFWDGEFRDTCGAMVMRTDGAAHHPYARFEAEDGSSALVICNYDDQTVCLHASLENGILTKYRLVDDELFKPVAGGIVIPPRSAAVVF